MFTVNNDNMSSNSKNKSRKIMLVEELSKDSKSQKSKKPKDSKSQKSKKSKRVKEANDKEDDEEVVIEIEEYQEHKENKLKDYRFSFTFYADPILDVDLPLLKNKMKKRKHKNKVIEEKDDMKITANYQEATSGYRYDCRSEKDLRKIYHAGQEIQHYENDDIHGGVETQEWIDFMEDIDHTHEWQNRIKSLLSRVFFISIDIIELGRSPLEPPPNYIVTRRYKGGDNPVQLCNAYSVINHDPEVGKLHPAFLFKPTFKNTYLDANYRPDHCLRTAIIEQVGVSWNRNEQRLADQRKNNKDKINPLTYEYLDKVLGPCVEGDLIEHAVNKFFKPKNIGLYAYDVFMNQLECSYQPEKPNKHISCRVNILLYNGHIQLLNHQLKRLEQFNRSEVPDEKFEVRASVNFRLAKRLDCGTKHLYLENFTDLNEINLDEFCEDLNSQSKTGKKCKLQITTETSLIYVWKYLEEQCEYQPQIKRRGHDSISALYLRINDQLIEVINPPSNEIMSQLKFEGTDKYTKQEQFDEYHRLNNILYNSMINSQNISSYEDLDIIKPCVPGVLLYRFPNTEGLKPNWKCDTVKCYGSAFYNQREFCIANSFDRLRMYEGQPIVPSHKYLVERNDDVQLPESLLYVGLAKKLSVFSGKRVSRLLKTYPECVKILAYKPMSNEIKNKSVDALKQIYKSPILNSSQKKFQVNMFLGILEKTWDTISKAFVFHDPMEAASIAKQYENCTNYQLFHDKVKLHYLHDMVSEELLAKGEQPIISSTTLNTLRILEVSDKKPLKNGFWFAKSEILEAVRLQNVLMYERIKLLGGIPIAIHVDCIYFYLPPDKAKNMQESKFDSDAFENFGKFKYTKFNNEIDVCPQKPLKDETMKVMTMVEKLSAKPQIDFTVMEFEQLWEERDPNIFLEEVFAYFETRKRVILQGRGAGLGKSYLGQEYLKLKRSQGKRVMAIAHSIKRVQELKKELGDEYAMTIHKFLGLRLNDSKMTVEKNGTNIKLHEIDVLLIDEIHFPPISLIAHIKTKLIDMYPDMHIIATGDPKQSKVAVELANVPIVEMDLYYEEAVNSMFPEGIWLNINKRMKNEDSRQKLMEIRDFLDFCEECVEVGFSIPHVKYFSNWSQLYARHINEKGEFFGKILSYHRDTMSYVNSLIQQSIVNHPANKNKEYFNIGPFVLYPGQTMINVDYEKLAGIKRLGAKCPYIVQRMEVMQIEQRGTDSTGKKGRGNKVLVDSKVVIFKDPSDGVEFYIPEKSITSFAFEYCITIHSSQGQTYKDVPISFFDFDSRWINNNDMYVALSRTNDIEQLYIYNGTDLRINEKHLKQRIQLKIISHKRADAEKCRYYKPEDYIDVEWVRDNLDYSSLVCPHCNEDYSLLSPENTRLDFSIDRVDERYAHLKSNCVIGHRHCNNERKKLRPISKGEVQK